MRDVDRREIDLRLPRQGAQRRRLPLCPAKEILVVEAGFEARLFVAGHHGSRWPIRPCLAAWTDDTTIVREPKQSRLSLAGQEPAAPSVILPVSLIRDGAGDAARRIAPQNGDV